MLTSNSFIGLIPLVSQIAFAVHCSILTYRKHFKDQGVLLSIRRTNAREIYIWRCHLPLRLFAACITFNKQFPNSSKINFWISVRDILFFSAAEAWTRRHRHVASTTSRVTNENGSLSPAWASIGALLGRSSIWDSNFVFAAFCCCTRTSAASAKCIRVFLSGLSSKFLQPVHLQIFVHRIFAS